MFKFPGRRIFEFSVLLISLNFLISDTVFGQGQEIERMEGAHHFIEFRPHFGAFVRHTDSLGEELKGNYLSGELRIGFQSLGKKDWQHGYKLPSYGFGLYYGNMNNTREIGNPFALFAFFNVPIVTGGKLRLNYDFASGVAFNFNEYDSITNPRNDVLGSKVNIYFNLGLVAYYELSERLDLSFGADFTHFSNGAIRTPNKGLNMYGLNLGARYYLDTKGKRSSFKRARPKLISLPNPEKYWEFYSVISGGLKTTSADINDRDTYHPVFTFTLDAAKKYGHKGKLGAGVDYFYDGSMERWLNYVYPDSSFNWTNYSHVGIHIGHDLLVDRFALVTQLGVYLYSGNEKGSVWARVGLRYDFSKKVFARLSLKTTEGFIADLTEWGIGFRFVRNQSVLKDLY